MSNRNVLPKANMALPATYTPTFGSISHGTLRTEDLLETFAFELDYARSRGAARDADQSDAWLRLVDEARAVEDFDTDEALGIRTDLEDALQELALPYTYFGAHPGDGADFGFWPDIDALEYAARYENYAIKVNGLDEIPEDYIGDVMLVNDHGNVTYGVKLDGKDFCEIWACV